MWRETKRELVERVLVKWLLSCSSPLFDSLSAMSLLLLLRYLPTVSSSTLSTSYYRWETSPAQGYFYASLSLHLILPSFLISVEIFCVTFLHNIFARRFPLTSLISGPPSCSSLRFLLMLLTYDDDDDGGASDQDLLTASLSSLTEASNTSTLPEF